MGGYNCNYYVMQWMTTMVRVEIVRGLGPCYHCLYKTLCSSCTKFELIL